MAAGAAAAAADASGGATWRAVGANGIGRGVTGVGALASPAGGAVGTLGGGGGRRRERGPGRGPCRGVAASRFVRSGEGGGLRPRAGAHGTTGPDRSDRLLPCTGRTCAETVRGAWLSGTEGAVECTVCEDWVQGMVEGPGSIARCGPGWGGSKPVKWGRRGLLDDNGDSTRAEHDLSRKQKHSGEWTLGEQDCQRDASRDSPLVIVK
jgi:hypothetical protein